MAKSRKSVEAPRDRTVSVRVSESERHRLLNAAVARFGAGRGHKSPVGKFGRLAFTLAERGGAVGGVCRPGRDECAFRLEGGACTISAPLRVAARSGGIGTESIPARYCLVELSQLHTSHQPLKGFEPDPAFPSEAQERDYRLTAEQAKVREIARTYDPALIFNTGPGAVDGIPIATEDRIVLGGNGRTMATALVYHGDGDGAATLPRDYLFEHAHEFGMAPDQVEQFQRPMLVRTIRVARDARTLAEWSRRLNTSLSQALSPTHLAVSRARFVDDSVFRELATMDDHETLAAFLQTSRSRGFVRALQRSGIIDGRAAVTYLGAEGLLNEPGRDLAADLLVAVLLPDADLITSYGRGPVGTLARAAVSLVQVGQSADYDLRAELRKAVRDRITMRAQAFDDVGRFLRQVGLFGTGAAVADSPRATALLYILEELEGSPAKFSRFARRYWQLAAPGAAGQSALFASESVPPLEALRGATDQERL